MILVFDLDETLIATPGKLYDDSIKGFILSEIKVNHTLLDIIAEAKKKGNPILLLTNNENSTVIYKGERGKFIDVALDELNKAYSTKYGPVESIIDRILSAEKIKSMKRTYLKKRIDLYFANISGNTRKRYYAKPVKSLEDVRRMLGMLGMLGNNVKGEDVYFFDDDASHQLCKESNFIHITPPFGNSEEGKGPRERRGSKQTRRKLKDLRHGM